MALKGEIPVKTKEIKGISIVLALFCGLVAFAATAQNAAPQAADSFAQYGQEFKGKIGRTYAESEEWYPEATRPKPGTPNVLVILLDDVGYSQLGSYGGLIQTPNMDALAADGLRYNNFHTTALCSPSRAALMASRNPHRIGLGSHALTAMGFPGYNGTPPESAKSIAKDFQHAGFETFAIGPVNVLNIEPTLAIFLHAGSSNFDGAIGGIAVQHNHIIAEGQTFQTRLDVHLFIFGEQQYTGWLCCGGHDARPAGARVWCLIPGNG